MLDLVKKSMMVGVGLTLEAMEGIEDLVKELKKKGDLSEKDGKKLLQDFQKKYGEVQAKVEDKVEKTGRDFLKKVDIVTSSELSGLKKEIRELKKANMATAEELGELKKAIVELQNSLSNSNTNSL